MKKIGLIAVGVLAFILAAGMIAPLFIDASIYKEPALDALQKATGYEARIEGPISVSFFPRPQVSIQDISLKLPAQSDPDGLAHIGRLSVTLDIFPLISGRVVISSVSIHKPNIKISLEADGSPNWITPRLSNKKGNQKEQGDFGDNGGGEDISSMSSQISVDQLDILDGAVSVLDTRSKKTYILSNVSLSAGMGSLSGPFDLQGAFTYQGVDMNIHGRLGRMKNQSDDTPLSLFISADDAVQFDFSGTYAARADGMLDGKIDMKGQNMSAFLQKIANINAPLPTEKIRIQASISASKRNIVVDSLLFDLHGTLAKGAIKIRMADTDFPRPLVHARFSSDDIFDLRPFFKYTNGASSRPYHSDKNEKEQKISAPKTIFSFPVDMDAEINLAGVQIGSDPIKRITATLNVKGPEVKGGVTAAHIPGEGTSRVDIYPAADGTLFIKTDTHIMNTDRFIRDGLGLFLPPNSPLVAFRDVHLSSDLAVKETSVSARSGTLSWTGGDITFTGSSYKNDGGRPLLTLALSGQTLNLDSFSNGRTEQKQNGKTTVTNKAPEQSIKNLVKKSLLKINLPFDLATSVSFDTLKAGGFLMQNVSSLVQMSQNKLTIQSLNIGLPHGGSATIEGVASSLNDLSEIDMKITARAMDGIATMNALGIKNPSPILSGSSKIDISYKGSLDKATIDGAATIKEVTFRASGLVTDPLDNPSVSDLHVRVTSPRAAHITRFFSRDNAPSSTPLPLALAMDISAKLDIEDKIYTAKNISGMIGQMDVKGEAHIDMSGARPFISGGLNLGDVPLDALMGMDTSWRSSPSSPSGADGTSVQQKVETGMLRAADMDLMIAAKKMNYRLWSFISPSLSVTAKNGTLMIKDVRAGLFGGTFLGSGRMAAPDASDPLDMDFKGAMENVNARSLVSALMNTPTGIFDGTVGFDIKATARGGTSAQILKNMNGSLATKGNNITINGIDIPRLVGWLRTDAKLSNAMENLQGSLMGGSTTFETHTGNYTIKNGVVNLDDVVFNGQNAAMTSIGVLDVPLWAMNVKTTINIKNPADVPDISFTLKGRMDHPAQDMVSGAIEGYIQKTVQKKVNKLIEKKLGGKLEKLGLGGLLGTPGQNPAQGTQEGLTPTPPPVSETNASSQSLPEKINPEDMLIDVLKEIGK